MILVLTSSLENTNYAPEDHPWFLVHPWDDYHHHCHCPAPPFPAHPQKCCSLHAHHLSNPGAVGGVVIGLSRRNTKEYLHIWNVKPGNIRYLRYHLKEHMLSASNELLGAVLAVLWFFFFFAKIQEKTQIFRAIFGAVFSPRSSFSFFGISYLLDLDLKSTRTQEWRPTNSSQEPKWNINQSINPMVQMMSNRIRSKRAHMQLFKNWVRMRKGFFGLNVLFIVSIHLEYFMSWVINQSINQIPVI